mmetsp:Transcript_50659/g.120915  ORF Transcript_50659/g.120915 Transcript_50659/m.120915 type:complete len:413 (-) Transcript_50659:2677-3915(-)
MEELICITCVADGLAALRKLLLADHSPLFHIKSSLPGFRDGAELGLLDAQEERLHRLRHVWIQVLQGDEAFPIQIQLCKESCHVACHADGAGAVHKLILRHSTHLGHIQVLDPSRVHAAVETLQKPAELLHRHHRQLRRHSLGRGPRARPGRGAVWGRRRWRAQRRGRGLGGAAGLLSLVRLRVVHFLSVARHLPYFHLRGQGDGHHLEVALNHLHPARAGLRQQHLEDPLQLALGKALDVLQASADELILVQLLVSVLLDFAPESFEGRGGRIPLPDGVALVDQGAAKGLEELVPVWVEVLEGDVVLLPGDLRPELLDAARVPASAVDAHAKLHEGEAPSALGVHAILPSCRQTSAHVHQLPPVVVQALGAHLQLQLLLQAHLRALPLSCSQLLRPNGDASRAVHRILRSL